ncbi:MAG: permease [Dermatophilaceae bacterium]
MSTSSLELLGRVLSRVLDTLEQTWPFLVASIVLAAVIQVYVGTDRLGVWLRRSTPLAVLGAVALGALTPFCSCGTMAVVLGSLAASVPWAPIVAFMASSPLTSPGEYALSVGLFGVGFATTFVVAAAGVGLLGGLGAWYLERRGWLAGQSRVSAPQEEPLDVVVPCCPASLEATSSLAVSGGSVLTAVGSGGCCGAGTGPSGCAGDETSTSGADGHITRPSRFRHRELARALVVNARRLAWYFLAFASLGYLLIELIPSSVFETHLGDGSALTAVPLAALLGIPMYVNTEGSLPLVASLIDGGMGAGPALAFLTTGAGTSIGAISGMLVIARWRIVALVVGTLFVSACLTGWLAPLWL